MLLSDFLTKIIKTTIVSQFFNLLKYLTSYLHIFQVHLVQVAATTNSPVETDHAYQIGEFVTVVETVLTAATKHAALMNLLSAGNLRAMTGHVLTDSVNVTDTQIALMDLMNEIAVRYVLL